VIESLLGRDLSLRMKERIVQASVVFILMLMVIVLYNDVMKQLTILSAVFMPLTFLTGFFGQNFHALPVESTTLYWCVVAACALLPFGMLGWFRWRHWL